MGIFKVIRKAVWLIFIREMSILDSSKARIINT
jgi:hypothetical protein